MPVKDHLSSHQREFQYGRSTIEYELIYAARKNLAITVKPDKSVVVKAPSGSSREEIEDKLIKRGGWILKQINYFDRFHPLQPERKYVSGETHYYLGRQYRLRVQKDKQESVKLVGKFFIVRTLNPDERAHVKLLLMNWYADHAQILLDRRTKHYAQSILGSDFKHIETRYKHLKRRWGSCDPNGTITFNIELVKAPIQCVDYVIVHELCHLKYLNHDKAFYRLMQSVLPDWQQSKEKLELFGVK